MSSSWAKAALGAAAAFAVAACGQQQTETQRRGFSPSQYGVPASPRVVQPGEAVPRGGGVMRIGRAYTVRGRTYTPRHDPSHDEVGVASWYGDDFHGRRTANGEVYDMYALSAAHRTLPMPSYVRVTNAANGRSVIVRVNDRGPFHDSRVIDLSKRAAMLLDMRSSGLGRVRVTYVGRAPLDGNDDWLVTTVRENGRPVPATRVAALAPVPAWAQRRPDATAATQAALTDRLAPLPEERPRDQPVQATALSFVAPGRPGVPASRDGEFATTVRAALRASEPGGSQPLPLDAPRGAGLRAPELTAAPTQRYLHVGSFRDPAEAHRLRDAMARHGTAVVEPVTMGGTTVHQLQVGPLRDARAADEALRAARGFGAHGARIATSGGNG
jgi:rare lipoprotein A